MEFYGNSIEYHGSPWISTEFRGNSMVYAAWNPTESPLKILRFPVEFHGYETGNAILQNRRFCLLIAQRSTISHL